jgi:AcrR family transcriptional regulator
MRTVSARYAAPPDYAATVASTRRAWGSLTREQIVRGALAIARRDGVDALTIRNLAAEVGASRMALYRHVPDKEALLDLAAGAIAEADLPGIVGGDGDWETQLRRLARTLRERLHEYPGLAELLLRRANASPAGLALADYGVSSLRRAGLGPDEAARGYIAFFDVVLSRVHREVTAGEEGPEQRLHPQVEAADPDSLPQLADLLSHLEALGPDDIFETELDLMIAGLRERIAQRDRRA